MSSTSESITWQTWSQKWGDWTTWFRNVDTPREALQRHLILPISRAPKGDGKTSASVYSAEARSVTARGKREARRPWAKA